MDRRERVADQETALREAFDGLRSGIWTALPCIIESFDAVAQTCSAQPTIKMLVRQLDGTISSASLPLLLDCPVQFPGAGGCSLTFPVAQGDECLVVFASRCIDSWWQSGGVQEQAELRMHDLSDGFAVLGFRSRPRALPNISATSAQLRSDDGATFIDLNSETGEIKVVAPGGFDVIAPHSSFSGSLLVKGVFTFIAGMVGSAASGAAAIFTGILNVVGQITANGKRVDDTHTHNGVQSGSGNSGQVN
ncbi:Gp138 family membrane-puncturing spike protein [Herbaspirillum robiniae]|uniref:Gp138 family membrane-puncturing spike protein n=1 Tax=Herbaspirillum robiniae TaxID=2014887 RepID=UPI0009A23073|nr:Gp138 family membrane-puncturing spike protein [Herbaspirillum robiniae]